MANLSSLPGFQHDYATDHIYVALSEQQKRNEGKRHRNRNRRVKARERKERKREAAGKDESTTMSQTHKDVGDFDEVIDDNVSGQRQLQVEGHSYYQNLSSPPGSIRDLTSPNSDFAAIDDATTMPGLDGPADSSSSDLCIKLVRTSIHSTNKRYLIRLPLLT